MHKVQAKGILSAGGGMNIYRGCQHGCIYCDSRSSCYQMNHNFEDIEVKENAPRLLEDTLRRKRKKCMIGTGAMGDPYTPAEAELGIMRKCLEIIDRYGFGLAVQTKSNLILRDLDLLKSINERSKCVVQMTITTYDDSLCRIIEPNVCVTSERVKALEIFRNEGIPTIVWLTPILPYINDTEENIRGIMDCCVKAGVKGIIHFGMGLTLRNGSREYFYSQTEKYFPEIKEIYTRTYGNNYILPSPESDRLVGIITEICEKNGIMHTAKECFEYMRMYEEKKIYEQLSLF